jgi:hypothetical protein
VLRRGEAGRAQGPEADLLAELVERVAHTRISTRARVELRSGVSIPDFPVLSVARGLRLAVDAEQQGWGAGLALILPTPHRGLGGVCPLILSAERLGAEPRGTVASEARHRAPSSSSPLLGGVVLFTVAASHPVCVVWYMPTSRPHYMLSSAAL